MDAGIRERVMSRDQETGGRPGVMHIISSMSMGGAEQLLLSVLPELNRGYRAMLCCIRERGELASRLEERGVPVIEYRFRSRLHPWSLYGLSRLMVRSGVRLIHANMYRPHVSGILSGWLGGIPARISTVHTVNQWDSPRQVRMDRLVSGLCTRIVAVSEEVKRNYCRVTGVREEKVRVIYNGVDTDRFSPGEPSPELYDSLNLEHGTRILGTVGRLIGDKGHRLFLEAAIGVLREDPGLRILVIGDGPLRGELEHFVESQGIRDRVVFTGMRDDIPDLVRICTALIFPSYREGLSLALLEAMACGKAVIASDVGGNPEVIVSGESGFLFPSGDREALASYMKQLLNRDMATSTGNLARKRVLEHFSIRTHVEKTAGLYRECLTLMN